VLNDPKLDVGAVEMLATDLFAVPYQSKREFVRPHDKYNIVIALITTATARVFLYDYMDQIFNDPACKLLYTDTDSCYIVHPKGKAPPFHVGDMLGMMSREYEENHILSIYIGGCKQVTCIIIITLIFYFIVCNEDAHKERRDKICS